MFAESDLAEFEEARRRRNEGNAMSVYRPKAVRSTNTTSSGEVIAFTALRNKQASAKPKRRKRVERERAKKQTAKASLRLDDVAGSY